MKYVNGTTFIILSSVSLSAFSNGLLDSNLETNSSEVRYCQRDLKSFLTELKELKASQYKMMEVILKMEKFLVCHYHKDFTSKQFVQE